MLFFPLKLFTKNEIFSIPNFFGKCSQIRRKPRIYQHLLKKSHTESRPAVFLRKVFLKICIKFTGEQSCRSVISVKLLCNFIEIALWLGCSPVNLLYIFRRLFLKNAICIQYSLRIQSEYEKMQTRKTLTMDKFFYAVSI